MVRNRAKISVLMSVYKEKSEYIQAAIQSILDQSFSDFEFILINDNPGDERIKEILTYYKNIDSRIRVITNPHNLGLQKTLIKGVKLCQAEFIARMDADDVSFPDRFELQYKLITEKKYDVVSVKHQRIDMKDDIIDRQNSDNFDGIINEILLQKNIVAHSSLLIRKKTLMEVGNYRNILYAEDYDLLLRIIQKGGLIYRTKEIMMYVRSNPSGISKSNEIKQIIASIYVRRLTLEMSNNKTIHTPFDIRDQLKFQNKYLNNYSDKKQIYSLKLLENAQKAKKNNNKIKAGLIYLKLITTDKIFRDIFLIKLQMKMNYSKLLNKERVH